MATPYDVDLLDYYTSQRNRGAVISQQQQAGDIERNDSNIKQLRDIEAKRRATNQQGAIQAGLQGQKIQGDQTLAYQKAGYEYGLQGQQEQFQGEQNNIKFAHDTDLFERDRAGRLAEQHLGFLQQEKMTNLQAGIQEKRDQSQFMHEAALSKMAADRQEARDEILQRYKDGTLDKQYEQEAEQIKKEHEWREQQAYDTAVDSGIKDGKLRYDPETVRDRNQLFSKRNTINRLLRENKISKEDHERLIKENDEDIKNNKREARPVTSDEDASSFGNIKKGMVAAFAKLDPDFAPLAEAGIVMGKGGQPDPHSVQAVIHGIESLRKTKEAAITAEQKTKETEAARKEKIEASSKQAEEKRKADAEKASQKIKEAEAAREQNYQQKLELQQQKYEHQDTMQDKSMKHSDNAKVDSGSDKASDEAARDEASINHALSSMWPSAAVEIRKSIVDKLSTNGITMGLLGKNPPTEEKIQAEMAVWHQRWHKEQYADLKKQLQESRSKASSDYKASHGQQNAPAATQPVTANPGEVNSDPAVQKSIEKARSDPAVQKAIEKALSYPEVQEAIKKARSGDVRYREALNKRYIPW